MYGMESTEKNMDNKKPCPKWDFCNESTDAEHVNKYYHPCRYGKNCRNIVNNLHFERFEHVCPNSLQCVLDDEHHLRHYCHPLKLPYCEKWSRCKKTGEVNHLKSYLHPCPDNNCKRTEKDLAHTSYYVHVCKTGASCAKINDTEHCHNFTHPCPHGDNCQKLRNGDYIHMISFSHPLKTRSMYSDVSWPAEWTNPKPSAIFDPNGTQSPEPHFKMVDLSPTTKEYQDAANFIKSNMPNATIQSIQRIENEILWLKYCNALKYLKQNTERKLFHGTHPNYVDSIARNGFDYRLANLGGKYGGGIYCSSDSSFSNGYASADSNGFKRMFINQFIVGESYIANAMIQNITKPSFNGKTYDTVCSANGKEVVAFDNAQVYPEYLVIYKQ